jgi:hypothetical protein
MKNLTPPQKNKSDLEFLASSLQAALNRNTVSDLEPALERLRDMLISEEICQIVDQKAKSFKHPTGSGIAALAALVFEQLEKLILNWNPIKKTFEEYVVGCVIGDWKYGLKRLNRTKNFHYLLNDSGEVFTHSLDYADELLWDPSVRLLKPNQTVQEKILGILPTASEYADWAGFAAKNPEELIVCSTFFDALGTKILAHAEIDDQTLALTTPKNTLSQHIAKQAIKDAEAALVLKNVGSENAVKIVRRWKKAFTEQLIAILNSVIVRPDPSKGATK